MNELKLPLDFERLPEFWQLGEALRGRVRREVQLSDQQITGLSVQLWLRLWVVLGYLARSTNRAGWLNRMGEQQVNTAFDQFGDDCQPVDVLNGNLLRKVDDERQRAQPAECRQDDGGGHGGDAGQPIAGGNLPQARRHQNG